MKCSIILVGSELLNGMMTDTNSIYIAEVLNQYGIEIANKIVVGDKIDDIVDSISYAKKNSSLVIISGGLGPTIDDLTRDAVSLYCDKKLILNEEELKKIEIKYCGYGVKMTENNKRQIMFPEGSVIIDNEKGSAPAFFIDGIVCFPGVPDELKESLPLFIEYYVKKYNLNGKLYIKDILVWGIAESKLEDKIIDIIKDEKEIFVEFLVKDYGIIIRLNAEKDKLEKLENLKKQIYERVDEYIFGEDDDRLDKIVLKKMEEKNYKFSVAESCTGGFLSSIILSNSGASKVYEKGYITYSNESKQKILGVSKETLDKYGAVSEETVREMLEGLDTEIGIAISGIAGPEGGTAEKPVGTVFIGIKIKEKKIIQKVQLRGDRDRIRKRAAYTSLDILRKYL